AAAGVDKRAYVGLAGCDYAIERRDDRLERLERFQPPHIGLRGVDDGLLRCRIAGLFVDGLLRDRLRCDERTPALGGQVGELRVRLGAGQVRLGLIELLVEIRRIDRGQFLAGRDMRADILAPAFQIAADPRIDRGAIVGLDRAWERQGPDVGALLDL